jgi:hypothetical protein
MRSVLALAFILSFAAAALAVTAPEHTTAGKDVSIRANGSEVYVVCPGYASKHKAEGGSVTIKGDELQSAGRCLVSDGNSSTLMWVDAADTARVNFLAQPSRVAVAQPGAISGTVFVFDKWNNLVTAPTPVKFDLSVDGAAAITRTVQSSNGVAYVRTDSSKKEGNANFVASVGDISVKRVVRQTAADPCGGSLRMSARPEKNGILVQTAPVRDCSGNAVPDGTIVTFTSVDSKGKSTVDARVKKGIATAMLPPADHADISVASGITVGNEIRWGGGGK